MGSSDPYVQGDEVPQCITNCLSKAVASVNCSNAQSCWCQGNNEQGIKDALTTCYKEKPSACAEDYFRRMNATVDLICDQQAASNNTSSATASSTSTGVLPTASGTLNTATSGSSNEGGLSKTAMIGMSVGLGVAGLIILILLFLFIRERGRRKSMEFQEPSKRSMSKQSTLRPEHMSARDSVATKRTNNTQSVDVPVWRPARVLSGDSPPVPTPTIPTSVGTPVRDVHHGETPPPQQHTPRRETTPHRDTVQYGQRRDNYHHDRDTFTEPRLAYELPP